ncbi:MAG: prepilin-type N-terminal cleavage/methylation domain-containing protein [Candidatus Microsaccharimonas sp.]
MILKAPRNNGFTIVELLIVVVVIAILAAITIVAYNGIQKQAVTTSYAATIDSLEKQIQIGIINGKLTNLDTGGAFVCAGMQSDFSVSDGLAAGQCSTTSNYLTAPNSPVYANDTISATLKSAGVRLPGELTYTSRPGIGGSGGISARGIVLYADTQQIALWWYPPDTTSCGRASNETEALISLIKSIPASLTSYQNNYGPDWENTVRTALGGWCSLKIKK